MSEIQQRANTAINLFVQRKKALSYLIISLFFFFMLLTLTVVIFDVRGLLVFRKNPLLIMTLIFGLMMIWEMNNYDACMHYSLFKYQYGLDGVIDSVETISTNLKVRILGVMFGLSPSRWHAICDIIHEIAVEATELYCGDKMNKKIIAVEIMVSKNILHVLTILVTKDSEVSILRTVSICDNLYDTVCYDNTIVTRETSVQLIHGVER